MSILYRGDATARASGVREGPALRLPFGVPSRYLTDGVSLFRFVGHFDSGIDRMVGLENCGTLSVSLFTPRELRARRLRPVIPAAD